MFSVVISTYNRLNNVKLVLASLEAQVESPEFEVIVSDDGSTDGTRAFCENYSGSLKLKHVWCGPNLGFRTARVRNLGVAHAKGDWVILLDSDVVLHNRVLWHHDQIRKTHPGIVLIGMYHFSNKGDLNEDIVKNHFDQVMNLVPNQKSIHPPAPGLDCRIDAFTDDMDAIITEYDGLGFLGGNLSWPVELWWKVGGMDEMMPSGQGEDAEMGQKMRINKLPTLNYRPIWGVHLWHPRDPERQQREVKMSIKYIDQKYHIGTYADIVDPANDPRSKDSSVWYTKESGARLVRIEDEPTVYAISRGEEWYVGLPSPDWLNLLDFKFEEAAIVERSYLNRMEYKGTIRK